MDHTPGTDRIISDMFAAGDDDKQIGKVMGCTAMAVKNRRRKLGLHRVGSQQKNTDMIPIGTPGKSLHLRLDPTCMADLEGRAQRDGVSTNKYARLLLYRGLDRERVA